MYVYMCLCIYVYFISSMYSINCVIVGFWPSTANCDLCALLYVSVQRNRGLNSIFQNIELAIYYERGLFSVFFNANHTCLRPLDPEISVTKGRLIITGNIEKMALKVCLVF